MSRKRASAQSAPWARPSKSEATASSPTATAVLTRQAEDRVAQGVVLGAGEHEEGDVGDAHDAVDEGEGEGQARRTPRARRARRAAAPPSRRT